MSRLEHLQGVGRRIADDLPRLGAARALSEALPLLAETWVLDYDGYDDWLMTVGDAFTALGDASARGFTRFARGDLQGAIADQDENSLAAAFLLEAAGKAEAAARIYQRRGRWALAAYALEAARLDAAPAWEAAIAAYPEDVEPVAHGLAWLGLAEWCLLRDPARARRALQPGLLGLARFAVEAEEADDLEAAARRYALMADVGIALGAVEHLLEGALNAARVLEATGDPLAALATHHATAAQCVELGEPHAAALAFQDAARLAEAHRRSAAPSFWQAAADCWLAAAEQITHLPVGFAENALLARVEALNQIGAGASARETLRMLERLPLAADRSSHYAILASRLGAGVDAPAPPPVGPPPQGDRRRFADLLAARELGDDLEAALLDQSVHAPSPALRRDAMAALLNCRWKDALGPQLAARVLAHATGEVGWTALERLMSGPDAAAKGAALAILAGRPARRATALILGALVDPHTREAAGAALLSRARPAALGLLARAARRGGATGEIAIRALGQIGERALDALWQLATGGDAVGQRARAEFERLCPPERRRAYG